MNTVVSTYSQIVGYFQEAADNHVAVKHFAEGAIDYLDANSQDIRYPFVFLRPLVSPGLSANQRQLTFEVYSLDVPKLSDESPLQVKSNTELYLYDILSYVNYGPVGDQNGVSVTMNNITPVNEAFNDKVYGWVGNITVQESGIYNYCFYPSV